MEPKGIRYFATPAAFRAWLERHHESAGELWVGFHKKSSGAPSLTWPESVDQALCFGWIDGLRKNVDATRYTIRFTPRKPRSVWSAVNIRRFGELEAAGEVRAAGHRAFAARRENRSGIYSYEQRSAELPEAFEQRLKRHRAAAAYFHGRPPSYRKAAIWWVVSAKKEETRERRFATLVELSAENRDIPQFVPTKKRT
jgi:uncharacterized protein YdeI (YjbR/CyaY-like superfamily)